MRMKLVLSFALASFTADARGRRDCAQDAACEEVDLSSVSGGGWAMLQLPSSTGSKKTDRMQIGESNVDHWWMRLALQISQSRPSVAVKAKAEVLTLSVSNKEETQIPRIFHTVVKDCKDSSTIQKLQDRRRLLLAPAGNFEARCYDDASMPGLVKQWLPQYLDIFEGLPRSITRADLFRYMAIWQEGGFYADDDVEIFPGFLPGLAKEEEKLGGASIRANTSLIVGWERYSPDVIDKIGQGCQENSDADTFCDIGDASCMLCNSLAQWTFGAKPKDPVLLDIIETVVEYFANPQIQAMPATDTDVLVHTGPILFSTRVLKHKVPEEVLGISAFGCLSGFSPFLRPYCDVENKDIWSRHLFEGRWRS